MCVIVMKPLFRASHCAHIVSNANLASCARCSVESHEEKSFGEKSHQEHCVTNAFLSLCEW